MSDDRFIKELIYTLFIICLCGVCLTIFIRFCFKGALPTRTSEQIRQEADQNEKKIKDAKALGIKYYNVDEYPNYKYE